MASKPLAQDAQVAILPPAGHVSVSPQVLSPSPLYHACPRSPSPPLWPLDTSVLSARSSEKPWADQVGRQGKVPHELLGREALISR